MLIQSLIMIVLPWSAVAAPLLFEPLATSKTDETFCDENPNYLTCQKVRNTFFKFWDHQ